MRTLTSAESKIKELLKAVIDPELMINIVDLGLVYDIRINTGQQKADADITLTTPGCPLSEVIIHDVRTMIETQLPGYTTHVNLVWEPPWTPELMTEDGKQAMGR